jgi:hypothetical protein
MGMQLPKQPDTRFPSQHFACSPQGGVEHLHE